MDNRSPRLGERNRSALQMWPFQKRTKTDPEMGTCPTCGGMISYGRVVCRNRLAIPTCSACNRIFDRTFSPSFVFVHVESQRRKCKHSPAKTLLRSLQTHPVVFVRNQYWLVYNIAELVAIYYDSLADRYDAQCIGEDIQTIGSVEALLAFVDSLQLADR